MQKPNYASSLLWGALLGAIIYVVSLMLLFLTMLPVVPAHLFSSFGRYLPVVAPVAGASLGAFSGAANKSQRCGNNRLFRQFCHVDSLFDCGFDSCGTLDSGIRGILPILASPWSAFLLRNGLVPLFSTKPQ